MKTATVLGATRTYSYSAQHRLKWTQPGSGDRIYYDWDEVNDRRTGEGVGTYANEEWSAPSTYTMIYDYDEAGALVAWDDERNSTNKRRADYTYDSEGQRTRTVLVEDYGDSEANQTRTTTDYLYDGLALVSETITRRDGNGVLTGKWQLFYFYDASGRPYAAIDRKLSVTTGNTHSFYLVTDDRGDVLELLEADHIAFGSYRYDVYGRPTDTTARTTSTTAMDVSWMAPITEDRQLLRYAGYVYDAHAELYYLQRRYYDPITRQFLSRDPLKSDGTESPYQYCGGNPVAGVDPWGLYVTASGGRTNTWFRFPAGDVKVVPWGSGGAGHLTIPQAQELEKARQLKKYGGSIDPGGRRPPSMSYSGLMAMSSKDPANLLTRPEGVQWRSEHPTESALALGVGATIALAPYAYEAFVPVAAQLMARYAPRTTEAMVSRYASTSTSQYASATNAASSWVGRRGWQLANAPYQVTRNAGTTVGNRYFSGHAFDQMQNRGFTPTVVENAIHTGVSTAGKLPNTLKIVDYLNNVTVIVDEASGRVISVW